MIAALPTVADIRAACCFGVIRCRRCIRNGARVLAPQGLCFHVIQMVLDLGFFDLAALTETPFDLRLPVNRLIGPVHARLELDQLT